MRGRATLATPEGTHQEQDGPIYRSWGGAPRGFVSHRDLGPLDGSRLQALIQGQLRFFSERGLAFEWKTYSHDSTADLSQRLLAAGFVPEETESLVIGDLAELSQTPRLPVGVRLRRIHSRHDTDRMAELLTEVDGADRSFLSETFFKDAAADPDHVVLLVAEVEGRVVATAKLNLEEGAEFASLWAGSTLAEWRGLGIYRALVAHRAALAAERGLKYLQVDASEASRPILERLGFHTVSTTTPYIWSPPA